MVEFDSASVTTESSGFGGEGNESMSCCGEVGEEGDLKETNIVVMNEVMVASAQFARAIATDPSWTARLCGC
jgi:hypothetical protein